MITTTLIAALCMAAPDGGTPDGPYAVAGAERAGFGNLGPGWWLSDAKMAQVGTEIVALKNRAAAAEAERDQALAAAPTIKVPWTFWAGVALGSVFGVGSIVAIHQLTR